MKVLFLKISPLPFIGSDVPSDCHYNEILFTIEFEHFIETFISMLYKSFNEMFELVKADHVLRKLNVTDRKISDR